MMQPKLKIAIDTVASGIIQLALPKSKKKSAEIFPEIDIISDINAEFEATEPKPMIKNANKRPTQLFINDSDIVQTKNENNGFKATNKSINLHVLMEPTYSRCR